MSVFCLPTAWVSTRRTKSWDPPAIFALESATPMNLSSTEVICSRETSLSSAMAIPNFWTSRASSCLSTLAASCSPKLMSRMAARCVPASSSGLLAIGDPILHDLCRAPGILADQGSRRRDLLFKTGGELDCLAALTRNAHPVALYFAGLACPAGEPGDRLGQRLHQRPQHQERHHQDQGGAHDLFRELRDPRRFPQRQAVHGGDRSAALEGLIEQVQLVAAILLEPDGFAHQLREAFDVGVAHRRRCGLAVGVHLLPIVAH